MRERLKRGDKSLVGNQGYRKYLKTQGSRFAVDDERIQAETRFDGKSVLRINTELRPKQSTIHGATPGAGLRNLLNNPNYNFLTVEDG